MNIKSTLRLMVLMLILYKSKLPKYFIESVDTYEADAKEDDINELF